MNIFKRIQAFLRHSCTSNAVMMSASYLKDGQSGVVFSLGKEYRCTKCGAKWHSN